MGIWQRITYPFRRAPRRPLAARRPLRDKNAAAEAVPLGMEATDLRLLRDVSRRNEALERTTHFRQRGTDAQIHEPGTNVRPAPEDETYAAWYSRAFHKKGSSHD